MYTCGHLRTLLIIVIIINGAFGKYYESRQSDDQTLGSSDDSTSKSILENDQEDLVTSSELDPMRTASSLSCSACSNDQFQNQLGSARTFGLLDLKNKHFGGDSFPGNFQTGFPVGVGVGGIPVGGFPVGGLPVGVLPVGASPVGVLPVGGFTSGFLPGHPFGFKSGLHGAVAPVGFVGTGFPGSFKSGIHNHLKSGLNNLISHKSFLFNKHPIFAKKFGHPFARTYEARTDEPGPSRIAPGTGSLPPMPPPVPESLSLTPCPNNYLFSCQPVVTPVACSS